MDDLDLGQTLRGFRSEQKVFGRYTLKKILGRGGMGVVWLARDETLERNIALKLLSEALAADREAIADLKRETRRALDLTHPHIVRIHTLEQDGPLAGISMEYVDGASLAERKLDQPHRCFSPAELTPWIAQLCAALAYAHEKAGIVHRDLKPANLMVNARGELKIADFGVAASLGDTATRLSSRSASTAGTPLYMSPQQMLGERATPADDLYALGATLYELLTGKPPFYTGNVLLQVERSIAPSLAARRAEFGVPDDFAPIPAQWETTIAALLAKDAAARPSSASEVARLITGESATPLPSPSATPKPAPLPPKPATAPVAPRRPPDPYTPEELSEAGLTYYPTQEELFQEGIAYYHSDDAKDHEHAVIRFRKAADQGFPQAQFQLGHCYLDGQGVDRDPVQAVAWVRKAADQGYSPAQCYLGWMYANGNGVAKDPVQAVAWYRKAADQGDADAQCNLAFAYSNGEGVGKDDSQAANWARKAADQNDAQGQYVTGWCYQFGSGVSQDTNEAMRWYKLAADQGNENAKKALETHIQGTQLISCQNSFKHIGYFLVGIGGLLTLLGISLTVDHRFTNASEPLILGVFPIWIGVGLCKFRPWSRWWATLLVAPWIFCFPLGTVYGLRALGDLHSETGRLILSRGYIPIIAPISPAPKTSRTTLIIASSLLAIAGIIVLVFMALLR